MKVIFSFILIFISFISCGQNTHVEYFGESMLKKYEINPLKDYFEIYNLNNFLKKDTCYQDYSDLTGDYTVRCVSEFGCFYDSVTVYQTARNFIPIPTVVKIGETIQVIFNIHGGNFDQEQLKDLIIQALKKEREIHIHRKHVCGLVFSTYPPVYSCKYCEKEINPAWGHLLPKAYDTMQVEYSIDKTYKFFMNGYDRFCDSLKEHHINEDSFFMAKWNEIDTSCLSSQIELNKSRSIRDHWKKTHKKGRYYFDKSHWMDTDGFMGNNGTDGNTFWVGGGGFSDSILLADKWYKIIYDKKKENK